MGAKELFEAQTHNDALRVAAEMVGVTYENAKDASDIMRFAPHLMPEVHAGKMSLEAAGEIASTNRPFKIVGGDND